MRVNNKCLVPLQYYADNCDNENFIKIPSSATL